LISGLRDAGQGQTNGEMIEWTALIRVPSKSPTH
jgi:hypothetical protein